MRQSPDEQVRGLFCLLEKFRDWVQLAQYSNVINILATSDLLLCPPRLVTMIPMVTKWLLISRHYLFTPGRKKDTKIFF